MTTETDNNPRMNLYLGAALKGRWTAYCARAGKKPGTALREAIEAQLAKGQGGATQPLPRTTPKQQKREAPDNDRKRRIELRLTPSEHEAVAQAAEAGECSLQFWVINAIREALTQRPQFDGREWKVLGASNYELLAIGRNLNQIARHLNEQAKGGRRAVVNEQKLAEAITTLRKTISRHTAAVNTVMRASTERWRLT